MEKLFTLPNDGLNMAADGDFLYLRCKRDMYKYTLDGSRAAAGAVFKKDGKARTFALCGDYILLLDFCDLYTLDRDTLATLDCKRLGEDLSTDLINIHSAAGRGYISVRNGRMAAVDPASGTVDIVPVSDESSWDFCAAGDRLYIGTTGGALIEADVATLRPLRERRVCAKNIYGVAYREGLVYTISQDMTIKALDAATLEVVCERKKAVKGMTKLLGFYGDCLVVANGGVSLWDVKTLEPRGRFDLPTGQFNKGATLLGGTVYGSDYEAVYRQEL